MQAFKTRLCIASLLSAGSFAANAVTLSVDFNSDASPPVQTQSGWLGTDSSGNGTLGSFTVATTGVDGGTIDHRDRDASNGGGSESAMWQDFIFVNDSSSGTTAGMQITVGGLAASTEYPVTIWAYDNSSNSFPPRVADWSAAGGGSGTVSFNPGATGAPTDLTTHSFTSFNATTDSSGVLVLTGLPASSGSSSSHDVFINGLQIGDPIPEPSALLLGLLGAGMMLRRRRH